MNKKCAVFGHRKIEKGDKLYLENRLNSDFEQFINRGGEIKHFCLEVIANLMIYVITL